LDLGLLFSFYLEIDFFYCCFYTGFLLILVYCFGNAVSGLAAALEELSLTDFTSFDLT